MNPNDLTPAFLEPDDRQDGVKAIITDGPNRGKPVFLKDGGRGMGVVPYQTAYFHNNSLVPFKGKGNSTYFRAAPIGSRSFDRDTPENRQCAIREATEIASRFVAENATKKRAILPAKENEERFPRLSFLIPGKFRLPDFITVSLAGFGDEEELGKFYELVAAIEPPAKGFNPSLEVGSALRWGKDAKFANAMVLVGPTDLVAKCFRYVAEIDQRPWRVIAVSPNETGDKVAVTATFREKEETIEEFEGIRGAMMAKGHWNGSMVEAMESEEMEEDKNEGLSPEFLEVTPPPLPREAPTVIIPVPSGMTPPPPPPLPPQQPQQEVVAPTPVSATAMVAAAPAAPTPEPPEDLASSEDLQTLQIGGVPAQVTSQQQLPPLPPQQEEVVDSTTQAS